MAQAEMNRAKVVSRLLREGWELARHGGGHDIYRHPKNGVVAVPKPRARSPGVARSIARSAGWL